MARPKSIDTEYRNYELPLQLPVLLIHSEEKKTGDAEDRLHFHNCLEIGYCRSGRGKLEFLGESFSFREMDISVIPKNILHTVHSVSGEESLWSFLYLDPQELLCEFLPPPTQKLDNLSPGFFPYRCPADCRERHLKIFHLVTMLLREMEEQGPNFAFSVKGLALSLYMELARLEGSGDEGRLAVGKATTFSGISGALCIMPALSYIEGNYMRRFPIEHLADLCHWSPTHFRRMFHSIMGMSPLEFVNATRVSKACMLLCTTEDSILNISETVGFHSVSSFNRAFQKTMQMSPRDYRRQLQKNRLPMPAYDTAPASRQSSV